MSGGQLVVGMFQQSSMTGRGTVGWVAEPAVSLPVGTQSDRLMVVVAPSGAGGQPMFCWSSYPST